MPKSRIAGQFPRGHFGLPLSFVRNTEFFPARLRDCYLYPLFCNLHEFIHFFCLGGQLRSTTLQVSLKLLLLDVNLVQPSDRYLTRGILRCSPLSTHPDAHGFPPPSAVHR